MKKNKKKLRSSFLVPKFIGLVIVLVVLTVTINYLFFYANAQNLIAPLEAEIGIASGNILKVNDSQASGGSYIQFKQPANIVVTRRNDGMVVVNGFPRFLFGFYTDSDMGRQGQKLVEDLNLIAAAQYNLMHPALTPDSDTSAYRQLAPSKNIWSITPYYKPSFTTYITSLKSDMSIIAWDIADDFNYPKNDPNKTPAKFEEVARQLRNLNPNVLTYGAGTGFPSYPIAEYQKALDIIGIEAYPVGNKDGAYQTEMAESLAYYLYAREVLPANHTIFALPQTYAWPGKRWPTAQELRNMTYGALIARMNGIMNYTFYSEIGYVPNQTALWEEAQKLGPNLSILQQPLLYGTFSRYDSGTGSKDGTGRIHAAFWKYNDLTYVLVINTAISDKPKTASIPLPEGVSGTMRPLYGGDSRFETGLSISGNTLVGSLANYAVHAYIIGN